MSNENISVAPTSSQAHESNGHVCKLVLPGEELQEEKVKVGGDYYIASELEGPDLSKWLEFDSARSSARWEDGKLVGENDFEDYHATLICMGLKHIDTRQKVSKEKVKKWGSATQLALFNLIRELSGLTGTSLKKAKKD